MTLADYINRHYNKKDGLRLGQRFWNDFIKTDDELEGLNLFYEKDDNKAMWIIETWLEQNHYRGELPQKIKRLICR